MEQFVLERLLVTNDTLEFLKFYSIIYFEGVNYILLHQQHLNEH